MNALVTLLEPPFQDLTYSLPGCFPEQFWKEGQRVAVPLGRGPLRAGIIKALAVPPPEGVKLSDLAWPLECEPVLRPVLVRTLAAVAASQCLPAGAVMAQILPFLTDLRVSLVRLDAKKGEKGKGRRRYSLKDCAQAEKTVREELASALADGRAHMLPPRQDAARNERCVLVCSPPWPVRPNAVRQRKVLEYLMLNGSCSRRALIRATGEDTAEVIETLLGQGLVRLETGLDEDERQESLNEQLLAPAQAQDFTLTEAQQTAVESLTPLLTEGAAASRLLYGVTGSGKTTVYIRLAREALAAGRSVLMLAPEVALAHKLRRDFSLALPGADIFFYHGYQSQPRREKTYRELAARTAPCLVIGTRSAIFLPLPSLCCIILDEEHDGAFKQEERVPYHAKTVAWFRCAEEKALLLLGSATPDIKTWHASQAGALPALALPSRAGASRLPEVELVTMTRTRFMDEQDTILAPRSLEAIEQTLARGEQAIVMLNRRGFAPLVYCPDCRSTLSCPNCSVGVAFHRELGRLLCHYCGWAMDFPAPCPTCGSMNFMPMGEGTERTADYLAGRFRREVLRFDRDSTRRQGAMEEILARFAAREADLLVGTQMLSKGHHFPDVTLAVVADGDLGLGLPDYRAAERTFQLLVQSSGRAGRGEKPGHVLIQTRNTDHYCWKHVISADYEGFYAEELARRKKYRYPPFCRVSLIRFSYERGDNDAAAAFRELQKWIRTEGKSRQLAVLGPVQAPLAILNNRLRFQCLIKSQDWASVRRFYMDIRSRPAPQGLRISLDLDPYAML